MTIFFHAETEKYKCTQCKKHFSPNINLKSHTGVKPERCTHCNFSANQGASLKKHILKHTGENPRHCQQCEHTSTLKSSNLRKHMMWKHVGEQPHLRAHTPPHTHKRPHTHTSLT